MGCKGSRVRIPPPRPLLAKRAEPAPPRSNCLRTLRSFQRRPMHILVSNDDGYLAPGLRALADGMRAFGDVTVVAPEQNCSGASNSLTLTRPLSVRRADNGYLFVNGTPTDCVHIALTGLLDRRPDLVVSG